MNEDILKTKKTVFLQKMKIFYSTSTLENLFSILALGQSITHKQLPYLNKGFTYSADQQLVP